MSEISVYNKFAPRLVELGYLPLALGPKSKIPQSWIPSEQRFVNTEGWNHPNFQPRTTPQPGAGIGVRCGRQADGSYLVGLDADSEAAALAAIEFPGLAVTKFGKRGFTGFFRSLAPVASRGFRDAKGNMLLQVLGDGTQSVLPPTIHPDTQKEYVWTCDGTLYDIPFANLPQWPADAFERIEEMMRPLGWEPEPERPTRTNGGGSDSDSPFRQVNDWALGNLSAWVPDLGLQDCKRQRGRFCSYRAVAGYREGAERADSLSFTSKGIKDFGTGESFTPINIVMRILGLSVGEAYEWLKARVAPERREIRIDFEALARQCKSNVGQTTDAPNVEENSAAPEEDDAAGAEARMRARGAWSAADDLPPPPECCFEELLPVQGLGTLDGPWGVHKTHVMCDLSVAMSAAEGDTNFAGAQRLCRRGVVILESEESQIPIRLACAVRHRETEDVRKLPIFGFREIPQMLINRKVNPQTMRWYREMLRDADLIFKRRFGVPIGMVGIDPLIDAYGAEKEGAAEEANEAKRAFRKLSQEFNVLFWLNDHMGKDVERGSRGTSAKPDSADFIFALPERVADPSQLRTMWNKKLRNLPGSGAFGVNFSLVPEDVETKGGKIITNLAVTWKDRVDRNGAATRLKGLRKPSRRVQLALKALIRMASERHSGPSSTPIWVPLDDWYKELVSQTIIEPGENQARDFTRLKERLLADEAIRIKDGKACVPF
jgi:hypothetical protein